MPDPEKKKIISKEGVVKTSPDDYTTRVDMSLPPEELRKQYGIISGSQEEIDKFNRENNKGSFIDWSQKTQDERDQYEREMVARSNYLNNLNIEMGQSSVSDVSSAIANDPNSTFSDLESIKDISNAVDNNTAKIQADEINKINDSTEVDEEEIKAKPGSSDALRNMSTSQSPTYSPTKEQLKKDQYKQEMKQFSNAPQYSLEKLSLQDYFPSAGRNIAVGTFTGSRIGSQTIYSGAGVLPPLELAAARQRALATAAKENQQAIAKFLEVPDTYKVYHDKAKSYGAEVVAEIASRNGYLYDNILKDREGQIRLNKLKGAFDSFSQAGAIVDEMYKKIQEGKGDYYIPKRIRDKAMKVKNGQIDPIPYLSGEKSVSELTGDLITYPSGTKWIDQGIKDKTMFAENTTPISLKNSDNLTAAEINRIQENLKVIKLNGDYDAYLTAVKKYYTLDPKAVRIWASEQGLEPDDEMIADWEDYLFHKIPEDQLDITTKEIANNAADRSLEYAKLNQRKKEFDWKKYQSLSYHNRIADKINEVGKYELNSDGKKVSPYDEREYFRKIGLTNTAVDGAGNTYAYSDVTEKVVYRPDASKSIIEVTDASGNKRGYTPSQLKAAQVGVGGVTQEHVDFATKFLSGEEDANAIIPDRIMYKIGGRDLRGNMTYDRDTRIESGLGVYSSYSGNPVKPVKKTDTDNKEYIKYEPIPNIRVISSLGDISSEQGKYDSDKVVGETTSPKYYGETEVKD